MLSASPPHPAPGAAGSSGWHLRPRGPGWALPGSFPRESPQDPHLQGCASRPSAGTQETVRRAQTPGSVDFRDSPSICVLNTHMSSSSQGPLFPLQLLSPTARNLRVLVICKISPYLFNTGKRTASEPLTYPRENELTGQTTVSTQISGPHLEFLGLAVWPQDHQGSHLCHGLHPYILLGSFKINMKFSLRGARSYGFGKPSKSHPHPLVTVSPDPLRLPQPRQSQQFCPFQNVLHFPSARRIPATACVQPGAMMATAAVNTANLSQNFSWVNVNFIFKDNLIAKDHMAK